MKDELQNSNQNLMAKRFTDSTKWSDIWFSELDTEQKLAYIYILDSCDQVGVWHPNFKLADFQLGFITDWNKFKRTLSDSRVFVMPNGNWWIKKFCGFQYGTLSEVSKSPTIIFYVNLLKKHSLWIPYIEGIDTPKEKDKDKDKGKDKEKGHDDFSKDLMSAEFKLDKENIEVSTRKFLDKDVLKQFNAHLHSDSVTHKTFAEYKKHLAAWLRKIPAQTTKQLKELD